MQQLQHKEFSATKKQCGSLLPGVPSTLLGEPGVFEAHAGRHHRHRMHAGALRHVTLRPGPSAYTYTYTYTCMTLPVIGAPLTFLLGFC